MIIESNGAMLTLSPNLEITLFLITSWIKHTSRIRLLILESWKKKGAPLRTKFMVVYLKGRFITIVYAKGPTMVT